MDTPPPFIPESPSTPPNPSSPPNPDMERTWCVWLHLSGFAGIILGWALAHILAPLILWIMKKDQSLLIDATGKEVLNFQISYSIYFAVSAILWFFCIGIFVTAALAIAWAVFIIIAAVKTSNGEDYRYPYIIRFLK